MITVNSREEYLKEVFKIIGVNCDTIELGVLNGDFSQMILDNLKPDRLYLIDPFEINEQKYEGGLSTAYSTENDYHSVLTRFEDDERVVVNKSYSYDAVKGCKRIFDFIYIDACHLYECVKQDLNDWFPKLKKGGLMCGHDYTDAYGFGVIQAVDEFCKEHNFEMIIYNNNGSDWALKQK